MVANKGVKEPRKYVTVTGKLNGLSNTSAGVSELKRHEGDNFAVSCMLSRHERAPPYG